MNLSEQKQLFKEALNDLDIALLVYKDRIDQCEQYLTEGEELDDGSTGWDFDEHAVGQINNAIDEMQEAITDIQLPDDK